MFDTLDALDCVSLLLGAAVSYLITQALSQRRSDLPAFASLLMFIGIGLILAYVASEALHMLKAARS